MFVIGILSAYVFILSLENLFILINNFFSSKDFEKMLALYSIC